MDDFPPSSSIACVASVADKTGHNKFPGHQLPFAPTNRKRGATLDRLNCATQYSIDEVNDVFINARVFFSALERDRVATPSCLTEMIEEEKILLQDFNVENISPENLQKAEDALINA